MEFQKILGEIAMIDEKKLIEEIDYYISHTLEDSKEHYAYNKAKELVYRQPKVGEWISVSERLPEESGEYLVWYNCGDDAEEGCVVVNFDAEVGAFGDWYDSYDHHTLGFLDSDFVEFETATAWMPLPESYKGE